MIVCIYALLKQSMLSSYLFKDLGKEAGGMINDGVGEEVSHLTSESVEPLIRDTLDAIMIVLERDGEGYIRTVDNDGVSYSLIESSCSY